MAGNPFIETLTTTKKHTLFTGRNALKQAAFFDKFGRCGDADEMYRFTPPLKEASYWGDPASSFPVEGLEVKGNTGVHAKMYILETGGVVVGSQNNGSSSLFEVCVLYHGKGSKMDEVKRFVSRSIKRARLFQEWFAKKKGGLYVR